ncbi:DUF1534 domain-containing protein [Pseudomonas syringae pv. actinidiae]|nr:DUF1534 domain-containing protein [Pseudomonas syringae pv. actinidiae]AYL82214.1 DUF1534 domain-containing protein [Pseudomonas syringae pv. actinidiae str. Shaanxi_M228]
MVPHAPAWECSSGRSASDLEPRRTIAVVRLSFRTLQRGNAVLDALRPILSNVATRTPSHAIHASAEPCVVQSHNTHPA